MTWAGRELPTAVGEAATDLGTLKAVRRRSPSLRSAGSSIAAVAFGVVFVSLMILMAGPEPRGAALAVVSILGVVIALAVFAGGLWEHRRHGAVEEYEFNDGLVRSDRDGLVAIGWRRAELVETITMTGRGGQDGMAVRRDFELRDRDRPGTRGLPLSRDDAVRIADVIAASLLDDSVDAARSPTGIAFGPVRLDRHGITANGEPTAWARVDRVVRRADELRLYRDRRPTRWVAIPISGLPNVALLIAVARRLSR